MKVAAVFLLAALCCGVSLASPRFLNNVPWAKAPDSCVGRCGISGTDPTASCQCNVACQNFGDCCSDFDATCKTCTGRCNNAVDTKWPCQCNTACSNYGDCCPDYSSLCGGSSGGVTNQDLYDLASSLHAADVNGAKGVVIDLQGKTTTGSQADLAPAPLFTYVPVSDLSGPTVTALLTLYDNYVANVAANEDNTAQEIAEEEAFLDAVFDTDVTKKAHEFLVSKGLMSSDINAFKDYYRTIWFGMYSRQTGYVGSSGFEHIFLGELKNGISGLHSWYRFYSEESLGNMNYLGYSNTIDFGTSRLIEMPMSWTGVYKSISSIAVGGSPELELALSTVCFITRPNAKCPVQGSNGAKYSYQTYTLVYNGVTYVGSAYPTL